MFISPKVDAQNVNHELTTRLAHTLQDVADVDLKTSWSEMDSEALKAYHIIHIFGCWNLPSARLLNKAHHLHIPTVYSPMGGLQPWVIRQHRTHYDYSLQRQVIQKASAIHLCSNLESEKFGTLGWNSRTALIKNPILTSLITFEQMAAMMLSLYEKVLNTHARLLLSDHSCEAIGHLMELGVDRDVLFDQKHCEAMRQNLVLLDTTDWQRIFLYAADEGITEVLKKGLDRIQFVAPEVVIEQIDRFSSTHHYVEGDLKDSELCYPHPSTIDKLNELLKPQESQERAVCTQLINLKQEMGRGEAPMLHLANIYCSFRFTEMDEDRLCDVVREMGLSDFAERLMAVLSDVMRLSEGFQPFKTRDDRGYQDMKTDITKFNTWA